MPTATQYETVKQQVKSFEELGYLGELEILPKNRDCAPKIMLAKYEWCQKNKIYHFSDPDWNVVIKQLAELYKTLKTRTKYAIPEKNEKNK